MLHFFLSKSRSYFDKVTLSKASSRSSGSKSALLSVLRTL